MRMGGTNSLHHASRRIVAPKPLRAIAVLDSAMRFRKAPWFHDPLFMPISPRILLPASNFCNAIESPMRFSAGTLLALQVNVQIFRPILNRCERAAVGIGMFL